MLRPDWLIKYLVKSPMRSNNFYLIFFIFENQFLKIFQVTFLNHNPSYSIEISHRLMEFHCGIRGMHNVCIRVYTLSKINYCKIRSNFEDAEKFSQQYVQPCTILRLQQWKLRTRHFTFSQCATEA